MNNVLARYSQKWRPANSMQVLELIGTCYGVFLSSIMKLCLLPLECVPHPNGRLTLAEMPAVTEEHADAVLIKDVSDSEVSAPKAMSAP